MSTLCSGELKTVGNTSMFGKTHTRSKKEDRRTFIIVNKVIKKNNENKNTKVLNIKSP